MSGTTITRVFILLLILGTPLFGAQDSADSAIAALRQGNAATAEKELRAELQDHPADPGLLGLLCVALDAQKKFEEAGKCYRQALVLAPPSVSLLNNYGNHLLSIGQKQEARAIFLRVIAAERAHPNANEQLARMAIEAGKGYEALRYLHHLPPTAQQSPELVLLIMRAAYLTGNTAEAEASLATVSAAAHDDARLSFSIALALAQAKQYGKAETFFSRALELDPANFDILYNLGLAASHAGHQQRAYEVLQTALQVRPDDVDVLYNLGAIDVARKRNENALIWLARAAKQAPQRLDVQRLLAQTAFHLGDYADSAIAWDRCAELAPHDDVVRRERGFTTAIAGQRKKGLADLDWYVARHPRDATGQYEDGVVQFLQPQVALLHLNRAISLEPDIAPAYFARGVIYGMRNDLTAALADLLIASRLEPSNAAVLAQLGSIYLDMKRPADALPVLRKAAELDPRDAATLFHLGRALFLTGHAEESRTVFVRSRTLGQRRGGIPNPGFVNLLAQSPEEQYERYRNRVENAVAENPQNVSAKLRLLKLDLSDESWDKAESVAREIAALHPPESLLAEAGRALLDAERYRSAKELLEQCPEAPGAALDLGIAVFYADGTAAGLQQMDTVPQSQRDGDYYLALAQMLDHAGRPRDAVSAAAQAIRSAPTRAGLYRQVSFLLIENGHVSQALALLDEAVKRLPDDRSILLAKAISLEVAGLTPAAKKLLKQIENRWPEWSQSYLVDGIILQTHGQPGEAQQELNTAVALGARDPAAWYSLAEAIMQTRPDDLADAQKAIQQALLLDPDDPWTHALAGRIYFQQKQYNEALQELQEAIHLRPVLAQAHYYLARSYRALGRTQESQNEFQETKALQERYPNETNDPDLLHSNLLGITIPQK